MSSKILGFFLRRRDFRRSAYIILFVLNINELANLCFTKDVTEATKTYKIGMR